MNAPARPGSAHPELSYRRIALLALLTLCVVALGLGAVLTRHSNDSRVAGPATSTPVAIAVSVSCHSLNGLPDPICTPGAVDPRVTQENLQTTICVRGYTKTVRPPVAYTDSLKKQQISAYGYADTNPADYEEDHLVPLELGGHPTDPKNLWPQPRNGAYPAAAKDLLENALHAKVCSGLVTLAAAQTAIARYWVSPEGG
jgi:hypothetical protein